jgi:hypothetical protein
VDQFSANESLPDARRANAVVVNIIAKSGASRPEELSGDGLGDHTFEAPPARCFARPDA